MQSVRKPGQRAGLTQARVRRGALIMLDSAGESGLTMRGLAERLGVRANALYSYTPSKWALIDDVLDDVLIEVESPSPEDGSYAALHTIMRSTYAVLIAHRRLVPLYVQRQGARGPHAHRLGDLMLDALQRAGIVGAPAVQAQHVLVVHAIGSAAYYTGAATDAAAPALDPEDPDCQAFLQGLDWLIAGIGVRPHV